MHSSKKTYFRTVIVYILIGVFCVICSVFILFMNSENHEHKTAVVYVDDEVYKVIELSDKIYTQYAIKTEYGINIIEVSDGKIRVTEADCPDKTCVKSGYTCSPWKPIICIPHKLEIIIEGNELDGVAQ